MRFGSGNFVARKLNRGHPPFDGNRMPGFARLRGQVGVAITEVIWICQSRREKIGSPLSLTGKIASSLLPSVAKARKRMATTRKRGHPSNCGNINRRHRFSYDNLKPDLARIMERNGIAIAEFPQISQKVDVLYFQTF